MVIDRLAALIRARLLELGADGARSTAVRFTRSRRAGHGDFSTPAAMRVPSDFFRTAEPRRPHEDRSLTPESLARDLAERLSADESVEWARVALPGFVNIRLTPKALAQLAQELVTGIPKDGPQVLSEPSNTIAELIGTHGRIADVVRWAGTFGMEPTTEVPEVFAGTAERALLSALADYQDIVDRATARTKPQPGLIVWHLREIENLFWRAGVHEAVLPKGEDVPTPEGRSRLLIVSAAETVLADGLRVLGWRRSAQTY